MKRLITLVKIYNIGGVWRSGLCVGVRIKGAQVQTPLQSACRCVPGQDTSPQIAPVGIAHRIEYVSRFGYKRLTSRM